MNKFKYESKTMGGYRCVTLTTIGPLGIDTENVLAGERGEIWENGPEGYKAMKVVSSRTEKIFSFKKQDLAKWVLALKVPVSTAKQAEFANNPNARFHD